MVDWVVEEVHQYDKPPEQVCLNEPGDLGIDGNPTFSVALAGDEDPATGMSTSVTFSVRTSSDRSPDSSISPAIALSRQLRKLSSRDAGQRPLPSAAGEAA
jgi:hypothetical protein